MYFRGHGLLSMGTNLQVNHVTYLNIIRLPCFY